MMIAFEPASCALLCYAVERACLCCLARPRRPIPVARLWLRRNSEPLLDALVEEVAEPLLSVDPAVLVVGMAVLLIMRVALAYRGLKSV